MPKLCIRRCKRQKLTTPKKSLKETNPYLQDPELRKALLYQSVSSSTAIEGVLTKYPKLKKSAKNKLLSITIRESEMTYK